MPFKKVQVGNDQENEIPTPDSYSSLSGFSLNSDYVELLSSERGSILTKSDICNNAIEIENNVSSLMGKH